VNARQKLRNKFLDLLRRDILAHYCQLGMSEFTFVEHRTIDHRKAFLREPETLSCKITHVEVGKLVGCVEFEILKAAFKLAGEDGLARVAK
jgi:hypothetical protein